MIANRAAASTTILAIMDGLGVSDVLMRSDA